MVTRALIRTASLAALVVAIGAGMAGLARASDAPATVTGSSYIGVAAADSNSRFVPLGIGKSVVIDLPRDIKDVLVADPKIANAVIRSARRVYLIGVTVGQTNVFFFDTDGRQIAGFDIAVTRDLNGIRAALKQALPSADVRIEGVSDGVMLTGSAASQAESQQAYDMAVRLVGDGTKVVNGIIVSGRDQVMLKVTVAEVQRDVIKQLGVDLSGSASVGAGSLAYSIINPFTAFGSAAADSAVNGTFSSISATLRAMERNGLVRTLAEPSLTAISGESAYFLAGGEFPIPANYTCDPATRSCQVAVQFKKFGVGLNFTPVVLAEGRISLKVMSEVSELSSENALTLAQSIGNGQTQTLTIPSVRTRRAETTVEVPSGGSLAMAGLIQEQTKQAINGMPGLMQVPVLGALFKSRDFINRQSELVVLVTPFIVRAVAQKDLSRPGDGFADASDPASVLLGRLNRIYGVPSRKAAATGTTGTTTANAADVPARTYHGKPGFILD